MFRFGILIHFPCLFIVTKTQYSVIEYSSFFAVRDNESGAEHPMGDGVDTLMKNHDEMWSPGEPGFVEAWTESLNLYPSETAEAYFRQVV